MLWLPLCAIGAGLLLRRWPAAGRLLARIADGVLYALMALIGLRMGASAEVRENLPRIGLSCLLICMAALAGSVALTLLLEKTLLSLPPAAQHGPDDGKSGPDSGRAFAVLLPGCILAGFLAGWFLLPERLYGVADTAFSVLLALLYLTVGAALGDAIDILRRASAIGWRTLLLPAAIALGSLLGGALCGLLPGIQGKTALLSAAGLGYYSYTGAFLTSTYGAEAGAYGFLSNVLRDSLTVLLLPLLRRLSPGSCLAAGAGGCMDTMLAPVTRSLGGNYALPSLLSGAAVTALTTVLLPLLAAILK